MSLRSVSGITRSLVSALLTFYRRHALMTTDVDIPLTSEPRVRLRIVCCALQSLLLVFLGSLGHPLYAQTPPVTATASPAIDHVPVGVGNSTTTQSEAADEPTPLSTALNWKLGWHDEFEGPTPDDDPTCFTRSPQCLYLGDWGAADCPANTHSQLALLNKCNWIVYDVFNDWQSALPQTNWNSAFDSHRVSVQNGHLILTSVAHPLASYKCGTLFNDPQFGGYPNRAKLCPFHMGAVQSKTYPHSNIPGFHQRYGRIEIRATVADGAGSGSAFWMLPEQYFEGVLYSPGWPYSGEIDIMEHEATEPNRTSSTLHGGDPSGGIDVYSADKIGVSNLSSSYHTYAVVWEPDYLDFYVDDTRVGHHLDGANIWQAGRLRKLGVPDSPFYLLLTMAVQNQPDPNSFTTKVQYIDYIRSYTRCGVAGHQADHAAGPQQGVHRIRQFVPGEAYVASGRTLLKVRDTGGIGVNMFSLLLDHGSLAARVQSYYSDLLGSQEFAAAITDVDYVQGYTIVSFSDGRILKVAGTGGTGRNMFAVQDSPSGFTGLPGFPYYIGSHRFRSAIRDLTHDPATGRTIISFANGKMLKVDRSGGSGQNLLAIDETASGFNGLPGYSYYVGDANLGSPISTFTITGGYSFVGTDEGSLLKILGTGGSGHNMFALTGSARHPESLPDYHYLVGDQQFAREVTDVTAVGTETLISSGSTHGKMLKVHGTGGSGHNMFAIEEEPHGFNSLPGYNYYAGDQFFDSVVTSVTSIEQETVIATANGKILKGHGTGGSGHNMFAVEEVHDGFNSLPGYSYLIGSASLGSGADDLNSINGMLFVSLRNSKILKIAGAGGTGLNMFAVEQIRHGFLSMCNYDYLLGSQNMQ